jgi:AraC family transcriptional regulator
MMTPHHSEGTEQKGFSLWRVEPAKPYRLEFENDADVVCLLLGSIEATTSYDGRQPTAMRFDALTAAYHPAGARVCVNAKSVSAGFVAFRFEPALQRQLFGNDYRFERIPTSVDNITSPSIAGLVAYARTIFGGSEPPDSIAVEAISQLAFVDVLRSLRAARPQLACSALSEREFMRLRSHIDENISERLSLVDLAAFLDMPVVTLRRRFQRKSGLPLHHFVLERRLQIAQNLLGTTSRPMRDIAAYCGFASQQHMTTVFSRKLGLTPLAWRERMRL